MKAMFALFRSVLKIAGACLFLFVISFLAGTKVLSAEPTLLHLDFQDGQGGTVQVNKATLVLVAGSYIDKLPLGVSADGVNLPLDASWLTNHWPGGKSRLKNMDRAYVFIKAEGYAQVCSNPIHWMGTDTGGLGKNVVVSFPRSKILVVSRGHKLSAIVDLRKPTERFLRLTNGKGKPIAGVRVKSYVYWSKTDQGDLNGADFLDEGTSDATGRVPILDGDFTYAFQLTHKVAPGKPVDSVLVVKRFEDKEYPVTVPNDPDEDSPKQ